MVYIVGFFLYSVIFPLLAKHGGEFEAQTRDHVHEYADAGLRTLLLGYREINEEEFREFNEKFNAARNAVSADRETLIDQAAETIERDLILLGATAVEDKLQRGVGFNFRPLLSSFRKNGSLTKLRFTKKRMLLV